MGANVLDASGARLEPARPRSRRTGSLRVTHIVERIITHALLVFFAVVFTLPLYWLVSNAVKPDPEMFLMPPKWIPSQLLLDRFFKAYTYVPYGQYTLNTMYICVYNVIATLVSCTLVAYGFARLEWKGRDTIFYLVIATMMLPYQVTLIPQYIVFSKIHWIGTFMPLNVPAWFGNPFLIFLMRQFFMTIPQELTDAARIDGTSEVGILWRILIPLSKPALATMAVFTFMWNWNDFFWPLIYLSKEKMFTLGLGLYHFLGPSWNKTNWGLLFAASTMMTLPPVILFFFAQRTFIEGITLTGIKG
jgi:ABC-type glycerol-3-phosphate transport system permease component